MAAQGIDDIVPDVNSVNNDDPRVPLLDNSTKFGSSGKEPRKVKFLVLGNCNVGKTSIILKFCTQEFSDSKENATLGGLNCLEKVTSCDGTKYAVQFWDTKGEERVTRHLSSNLYRDALGILLVYDVQSPDSLESLRHWWDQAKGMVHLSNNAPLPTVLLANKIDLAPNADVDDGIAMCRELRIGDGSFFRTSAKTGKGLKDAVGCLLRKVIDDNVFELTIHFHGEMPSSEAESEPPNSDGCCKCCIVV